MKSGISRDARALLSILLYGATSVTYGLVASAPLALVLGASVLVLVIAVEVFGLPPLKSPGARRELENLAELFTRRRRLFAIALVAFACVRAIGCIGAAAHHDWWRFSYSALIAVSFVGLLSAMPPSAEADSLSHEDRLRRGRDGAP
jgi:hypothetical protein